MSGSISPGPWRRRPRMARPAHTHTAILSPAPVPATGEHACSPDWHRRWRPSHITGRVDGHALWKPPSRREWLALVLTVRQCPWSPPPFYVAGQSAEVPRQVPVCVYRTFQVGRREPAAPVRTHTSLPSVWTPNTS